MILLWNNEYTLSELKLFMIYSGKSLMTLLFFFWLSKIVDQAVYYSRQLYVYSFSICQGTSNNSLSKDNVFIYSWKENDKPKRTNEISTALYHRLYSIKTGPNVEIVRLMAKGCGGQNKNSVLIPVTMVIYQCSC